jgi:hypothetical protein
MTPTEIVLRCACGLTYDMAGWRRLPFVGVSDLGGERLELRNCQCGSTHSAEIPPDVSVCTGCGIRLGAGDVKVAAEAEPIFCERCARECGLIANYVRRSAA